MFRCHLHKLSKMKGPTYHMLLHSPPHLSLDIGHMVNRSFLVQWNGWIIPLGFCLFLAIRYFDFWQLTAFDIDRKPQNLACLRDHRFFTIPTLSVLNETLKASRGKSKLSFFIEDSRGRSWRNFFIIILGNNHSSVLPRNRHLPFKKWFQITSKMLVQFYFCWVEQKF